MNFGSVFISCPQIQHEYARPRASGIRHPENGGEGRGKKERISFRTGSPRHLPFCLLGQIPLRNSWSPLPLGIIASHFHSNRCYSSSAKKNQTNIKSSLEACGNYSLPLIGNLRIHRMSARRGGQSPVPLTLVWRRRGGTLVPVPPLSESTTSTISVARVCGFVPIREGE